MTGGSPLAAAGLTRAQVAERVARGQVNMAPRRSSRGLSDILRANVFTRFNALLGSLFVLMLAVGSPKDALFGLVIFVNTAIGVVQEVRAKRTLDRLAVVGRAPVRVVRDGEPAEVPPEQIVLGDLVLCSPGDQLAVDGTVTAAEGLEVDESLLTGEAEPVAKSPGDRVLSGSFVTAGSGSFRVDRVGADAYAARLEAEASRFSLARSELRSGIDRFLKYVTWLIVPTAVLLTISQLLANASLTGAVSGTVAGVVTMVPEGLVLLTSMAFAVGVIRLGRRRCLVQELPAIEVLARVDVLCLDKTGTLTERGMELAEVRVLRPELPVGDAVRALAASEPRPNETMRAVLAGLPAGERAASSATRWRPSAVVPFSSARKWSGARFAGESGEDGAWVMGAPDVLLADGDPVRRDAQELAATGLRVLVAGTVEGGLDSPGAPGRVVPAALVVLRQRLRPDAPKTLGYFRAQRVAVKVISGDNAASVAAVAAAAGAPQAEQPVDARALPDDPAALAGVVDGHTVFGRVTPQQKRRFVAALQSRGHTVAMTGDGVNDVLALKDADLGVAMGSGSGASRAVAQIVLLDDDFTALPHVVAEGRRVLANIERVAHVFLTKTFYSMSLALLVGVMGLPFPFLPRHLTLIGSLTIGIPAFFLALAPSAERARPGFVPRVLWFAVPAGVVCAVATFSAYYVARTFLHVSPDQQRTIATITLFHVALWVLVLIMRPYAPWKIGLAIAMEAAFWLVLVVPFMRSFFALTPTGFTDDVVSVVIAAIFAGLVTLTVLLAVRIRVAALLRARRADQADAPTGPRRSGA